MATEQTITVSCEGGLNQSQNTVALFEQPGAATQFQNFEPSIYGGYRHIDGFTQFGTATPVDTSPILGIFAYADGVIACQATGIYFSTDGITWIQVNKNITAGNAAALAGASAIPKVAQGRTRISLYNSDGDNGTLTFVDGVNDLSVLTIDDSTGTRLYTYQEVVLPGIPIDTATYADRNVVSYGNSVVWSVRGDVTDFDGSSAGAVDVDDKNVGIAVHRKVLYILNKNSIDAISELDTAPQRITITKNVGCIDKYSIQEVASDVLFLAPDGIRTIKGTDRIDDIELSTVSKNINPTLLGVIREINNYDISSTVIREKNQYRLFYNKSITTYGDQKGVLGAMRMGQAGPSWEWSELKGIEVSAISSEMDTNVIETIYHGDYDGKVFLHTSGTDFNGSAIHSYYKTPDISFGDVGQRKTLYTVRLSLRAEGDTTVDMTLRYDYGSTNVMQPQIYRFEDVYPAAVYGEGTYGASHYGAVNDPNIKMNVEGSGGSCNFKFESNDTTSLYTIYGFFVDLIADGRVD
ncbi:hypothetical protein N9937_01970 [bacterium]|nr:hypothetical protein [bacterium]